MDYLYLSFLYLSYFFSAAFTGIVTNFDFRINMMPGNIGDYLLASMMMMIQPVIFDYIIFRYYLESYLGYILTHIIALLMNPLICLLFHKNMLPLALDHRFVLQSAILGIFCSLLNTYGGFLYSIILHWLAIVIWHLFLGGYSKY